MINTATYMYSTWEFWYDSNVRLFFFCFLEPMKRSQPVTVSDVTKRLDPDLWHPDAFIEDLGDNKNCLVNCMIGKTVPNQPMRKFLERFEYQAKRLNVDKGSAMLLKLRNLPPNEDFTEILPSRWVTTLSILVFIFNLIFCVVFSSKYRLLRFDGGRGGINKICIGVL